jgi:hypothetical protein
MGTGMALLMSPASESVMSALPQAQAGIGSAVNDTVREVTRLAPAMAWAVRSSAAAADQVATTAGPAGARLAVAAHQAFTTAMRSGLEVAAAVAIVGTVVAPVGLPPRGRARVMELPSRRSA